MIISEKVVASDSVVVPLGMFAFHAGMQLPSMMVAIGACAGFAAQLAVWQGLVQPQGRDPGEYLYHAKANNGDRFVFGEAINQFLFATLTDRISFLSTAAGLLKSREELPDIGELLQHVSSTVGSETFGVPRYPAPGEIADLPRVALSKTFHNAVRSFQLDGHPPEHWPALLGLIAWRAMDARKDQIQARDAVRILFESAVPMSKIDPSTVTGIDLGIDWKFDRPWSNTALNFYKQPDVASALRTIHAALPAAL